MSGLVEVGVMVARLPWLKIGDIALPGVLLIGPSAATTDAIGDHLARIGRALRRIVLPRGGGAVVQQQDIQMIAGGATLGVGFIDRQHEAVADAYRGFGIRSGQRKIDADGDGLVGGQTPMRTEHRDSGGASGDAKRRSPRDVRHVPTPVFGGCQA